MCTSLETLLKPLRKPLTLALALMSAGVYAQAPAGSFADYVKALRQDAEQKHDISAETLDKVFPTIKEFRSAGGVKELKADAKSLDAYLPATLTDELVDEAKFQYQGHTEVLTRIGDKYGVQPRFIIALWGLESRYGRNAGNFPVLSVTASKAFKGEDEAFFREQFFAALKIIDSGVPIESLRSDSDGRLGQPKLLPAGFLAYAKDGDGDGKIDIGSNPADVFASIASFLKESGWQDDSTWGRQVKIPAGFDVSLAGGAIRKNFAEWQALGVRRFDGADLPSRADMDVAMVMPDGPKGRVYLVYDNYAAIKRWRDDDYFALAMVHLSDRIKFKLGQ
ncbi:lytic murein transglycosylase [Shewanella sp. JM162201]|uniref:Lytic murein transglycosylase n=2 Tax=Shewanella jiangmenensis TaxID=2837387 RepID=A0ABS5V6V1_9GAMM|nr:lytic murein transglycosylase [Shewanella jiangmenensis]MBT1445577.1 lytic murein transglycosylase [Shewanella jiangmenensis]